jgi:hypothetical protein
MPITEIFWAGTSNQDIHVLRGQSTRDLTVNDLQVTDDDGDDLSAHDYLADNDDVELSFRPLFNGTPTGHVFSGQGIDVDMRTGQVTVDALPRPLPKNNFVIEVTATDPADDSTIDTETIRVHIHTSVAALALTPATLTIRPAAAMRTEPETTRYRFTVRAKFDDGTMGDLSRHRGVTWSSAPPDRVDPDTGRIIIAPSDAAGATITITATLPAELGGAAQTGTVRIEQPWRDDPDMPLTSIIVGGGWPGTTFPDTAPNVVFLSDGYTGADEGAFARMVTTQVHHLKTDRLLRPYDLLCTSMNFWRAFVPARERGISFRCEVYDRNGSGAGRPVPPPERPPSTGKWKIEHLIYSVGLPVPADASKSVSDLRSDWAALVGPLPDARIPDRVIETWKRIASRAFIQELDNFPALAFGDPPAANAESGTPELSLHPDRCGRNGLDSFLAALRSVSGVQFGPGANIGAVWARPPLRRNLTDYALKDVIRVADNPGLVFVCTTAGISDLSEPADYADAEAGGTIADGSATFQAAAQAVFDNASFVIVLSSFPSGRAVNHGRTRRRSPYIATSPRSGIHDIPLASPAGIIGFALNFTDVPDDATLDACRVTAHELAHSFGLGDEYARSEHTFPNDHADLADALNLQTEDDVAIDGDIDGDQIRWNWYRIRKAAVVTGAITSVAAGTFRIPVVPGHANQFRLNDTVLFRLRVPGRLLEKALDMEISDPLQIAVAPSASPLADYLVVQGASGVVVTLTDLEIFTPGSILFLPVPAPASVRDADAYPYAEMVAKNVKDLITSRHEPLYRRPRGAALTDEIRKNRDTYQYPDLDGLTPSLPGRPFCFKEKPRIVGLYEGGADYGHGIFHPTGTCIMRRSKEDGAEFCAVCRYVMVDYVDPFKHFQIDLDYDDIYPLR